MFDEAFEAIEGLGDVDLDALAGADLGELLVRCQRARAQLEAAEAKVLARWDVEKGWAADGAKSGGAWLAWRCRLPMPVANQRLRHARAMRELPAVADAWAAAEIDRSHVATLLGARNPRTEEAFAIDHKELLDQARTKRFSEFKRSCDMWRNLADQDGAEQDAEEGRKGREVHLSQTLGGQWYGRMALDPISGAIVDTTLSMIEQELYDADRAEAKARLGRDPFVFELGRTPAQRRADALVEMAIRARTAPKDGRRPAPLFSVVVGYETFAGPTCELWNRTVVTPGTLVPWLAEADVERVVFDGPSRVVDVGATRRFFRGALRRAIEVRDRTCFHDTCDDVPQRPEIDHIAEAAKGGPTTQDNGRLGCGFHNRLRNKRVIGSDRDPP